MYINILGSKRRGKKDFTLNANVGRSFSISAKSGNKPVVYFEDVVSIEWRFAGENIKLTYGNGKVEVLNFRWVFEDVKITEVSAKGVKPLGFLEEGQKFLHGGAIFTFDHRLDVEMASCRVGDTNAVVYITLAALVTPAS